jgi:long-chain acyl-CoA synthetase
VDLRRLISHMAELKHQNVIFTFEKGQVVRRTHEKVRADVLAATAWLRGCGVQAGMRVGMLADNCYEWIIYELALIELRALSVAFTDDFYGIPVH